MNKNIKLYRIRTYNLKKSNYIECNFSENNIKNDILKDESYHLQYNETENIILCFDIDHVKNVSIFNLIIQNLCDYFDIDDDKISYSVSTKENELSYLSV